MTRAEVMTSAMAVVREKNTAENRRRAALVAGAILYALTLHLIYQYRISPLFSYIGYRYRDPSLFTYVPLLGVAGALALQMPRRIVRPSDFILWVLFIVATIPALLVPQYVPAVTVDKATRVAVVTALCWAGIVYAARRGPRTLVPLLSRVNVPRLNGPVPLSFVWWALGAVTALIYAYIALTVGLQFRLVGLLSVTEIRFAYREELTRTGPLLAYLILLQGNIINPVIVARGAYARRWSLVAIGLFGQILIFSITGYKMILLATPAMLVVALLFRWRSRPPAAVFFAGALALCITAVVADALLGSITYTSVFVNRFLLTPGVLTAAHVQVFDQLGSLSWGYSFLSPFVDYPHPVQPGFLVGTIFSGDPQTFANANMFADGYMNLGYAGMVIESVVLVGILWAVDSAARGLPTPVTALIYLVPSIALANSSPFTALLTHGFLAGIVVTACLPRRGWGRSGKTLARDREKDEQSSAPGGARVRLPAAVYASLRRPRTPAGDR